VAGEASKPHLLHRHEGVDRQPNRTPHGRRRGHPPSTPAARSRPPSWVPTLCSSLPPRKNYKLHQARQN
jgi:hypothetical protein